MVNPDAPRKAGLGENVNEAPRKPGKTRLPVAGTDAPDRAEAEPLLSTPEPEHTSTRKAQEDEQPGG